MHIFVPEPVIGDLDGFKPDLDIFERAQLGLGLTRLVTSVQDPMVIALDADWGTGKSVFLKMWAGELRKKGIPVVYFDAFANDFAEDAFIAISSEIMGLAQDRKKTDRPEFQRFATTATKAGKVLLRSTAKIVFKAATMGALNIDDLEGAAKEIAHDTASEISNLSDQYISKILLQANESKQTLQAFRETLSSLPSLLRDDPNEKDDPSVENMPLVLIIDELDRCTPPFALNLLERIKHVFSVPNVHFVLGVHIEQICNSVRAAYGSRIDANTYLQKFIHITVPLVDTSEHGSHSVPQRYMLYLAKHFQFPRQFGRSLQLIEEFLTDYARESNMSLRSIERIYTTIAIAFSVMRDDSLFIPPLIAGLAVLKLNHPELYRKAKQGKLTYDEVSIILLLNRTPSYPEQINDIKWRADWWRFATDRNWSEEEVLEHARGFRSRFDRFRLLPEIANLYIDRFVPH